MAYALVSGSFAVKYSASGTAQTDDNNNMSGVDLVVIETGARVTDTITISDSNGNTYSALTKFSSGDFGATRFYYSQGGTYSNPFWVKITGAADVAAIAFAGFSGSAASPFDVEAGAGTPNSSTFSQATGATSALAGAGELLVSGESHYSASVAAAATAIDSTYTFTAIVAANTVNEVNLELSYAVASGTTAPNVTWFSNVSGRMEGVNVAAFKPGAGGGAFLPRPNPFPKQAIQRASSW